MLDDPFVADFRQFLNPFSEYTVKPRDFTLRLRQFPLHPHHVRVRIEVVGLWRNSLLAKLLIRDFELGNTIQ